MKPDQIERIFEPFIQADEGIVREYGGTGLGLPIAKNFVEMMGGKIMVESAPGLGSKFSFEIRFDIVNNPVTQTADKIIFDKIEKPAFTGEVLICEDNHMNQQLLCDQLDKIGLKSVVAHNGLEGVNTVFTRAQNGKKPFDLIFMDIHMPVMDGLEAASRITALGVKTPIVALTANILVNDLELYTQNGISGYLGKPFTSQELWRCLTNHLTPVSVSTVDRHLQAADDEALLNMLKLNFVKSNQNTFAVIQKAIGKGDVKLAHRLAHTLKGNAGQIGEKALQEAAAIAEKMLSGGENLLSQEHADILEAELKSVLEKLAPLLTKANESDITRTFDDEQTHNLFEKLERLLVNSNPECMNLLNDLRVVPGTEELVQQIEDFDFERAIGTFFRIRETRR
jgi:CheY-like chemotaxis protein